MRASGVKYTKICILLTTVLFLSFLTLDVAYSWRRDKEESGTSDKARIMPPGWGTSAATKKQVERIEAKEATKSEEGREVTPDLKKKKVGEAASAAAKTIVATSGDDTLDYDVAIGTGDNQVWVGEGENRRLIAEDFNGRTHIYAGFDNVGTTTIEEAMRTYADVGDIVIVKGGTYNTDYLSITNGVALYGGYNEDGIRDIVNTPTIITQPIEVYGVDEPTEINGVTIENNAVDSWGISVQNSSFVTICNSTMVYDSWEYYGGITVYGSSDILIRDNVIGDRGYVGISIENSDVEIQNTDISGKTFQIITTNSDVTIAESTPTESTPSSLSTDDDTTSRRLSTYAGNISAYNIYGDYDYSPIFNAVTGKTLENPLEGDKMSDLFKNLLAYKEGLIDAKGLIDEALLARLVEEMLAEEAFAMSLTDIEGAKEEYMEVAQILLNLLQNPTEEQKGIIETIEALIDETEDIESEEIKKTQDALIQATSALLLAQGIPDLLKEGDIDAVKTLFTQLNQEKALIILEYQKIARLYYESIIKELASHMSTLQIKDILAKNLTEKDLMKLSPNKIDEILDKIRKRKDKTYTERYILRKANEYKERYLTPAKEKLEENMTILLRNFTQRLFSILDEKSLIKEAKAKR